MSSQAENVSVLHAKHCWLGSGLVKINQTFFIFVNNLANNNYLWKRSRPCLTFFFLPHFSIALTTTVLSQFIPSGSVKKKLSFFTSLGLTFSLRYEEHFYTGNFLVRSFRHIGIDQIKKTVGHWIRIFIPKYTIACFLTNLYIKRLGKGSVYFLSSKLYFSSLCLPSLFFADRYNQYNFEKEKFGIHTNRISNIQNDLIWGL